MISNSPNGIASFGVPVLDARLARAAAKGAKVLWLDPRQGGGDAGSPGRATNTLTSLYAKMTTESGDCGIWLGTDGTTDAASRDTAAITWSKSGLTLIGECAPVATAQICRMEPTTTFAGPLVTVSGNNNVFANIQFSQTHNAASSCVAVSGNGNYFYNCHFAGIGHATAGDSTASDSLALSGSGNLFENCTIGLDTIARSVACGEIRCTGAAARNRFKNCTIQGFADNAAALWVIIGAAGIGTELSFENCRFTNAIDSTATVMTVGMDINASAGGTIYLTGTTFRYGATDWSNNFANLAQCMLNSGTAATDMGAAINGS
jgi:hypothetical protein